MTKDERIEGLEKIINSIESQIAKGSYEWSKKHGNKFFSKVLATAIEKEIDLIVKNKEPVINNQGENNRIKDKSYCRGYNQAMKEITNKDIITIKGETT